MPRRRLSSAVACLVGVSVAAGCVPYQKYDLALNEVSELKRVNEDLTRKYHKLMMERKKAAEGQPVPSSFDADGELARLRQQNDELRRQLENARVEAFTNRDREFVEERSGKEVGLDAEGGLILGSELLFPSGVSRLKKDQLSILDSVAELLRTEYPSETIIIEGHTDDVPLDKTKNLYKHNWDLAYNRALSVFEYFRERQQISKDQMIIVSYGYMKPEVPGTTEEARRQNRRVVIRRAGRMGESVARN